MLLHVLSTPSTFVFEEQEHALILTLAPNNVVLADFLPAVDYTRLINAELDGTKPAEFVIEGCLGLVELAEKTFIVALLNTTLVSILTPPLEGTGVEDVYRVDEVGFFCLDDPRLDPAATSHGHPCHGVKAILENKSFYLSKTMGFDLTSRLALRLSRLSSPAPHSIFFPLARKDDRTLFTPPETSLVCNPTFMYNYFILSPLLELREQLTPGDRATFDELGFASPCIQGFYEAREVDIGGQRGVLTILSRLSPNRSGTRFNRRGIDLHGNPANFAETETILRTANECFSFVQVRGSAPFFWREKISTGSEVTIAPELKSIFPFRSHFYFLFDAYREVHALNLMDNTSKGRLGGEGELGVMYKKLSKDVKTNEEEFVDKLVYQQFDVEELEKHHGGIANIPKELYAAIGPVVDDFGATLVATVGPYGVPGEVFANQEGVFRVNCRDCLDRTNIVEALISIFALDAHLKTRGLPPMDKLPGTLLQAHREMYSENGNTLSEIYTGAGSMFSHFTATGIASKEDLVMNAEKSAKRLYNAKTTDNAKQHAINELTGKYLHKRNAYVVDCRPVEAYVVRNTTGVVRGPAMRTVVFPTA